MKKVLIGVGILLVCAAVFVGFRLFQPIPDDLDLATTRATDESHFMVTISPENPEFRRNTLHSWIVEIKTAEGGLVEDAAILIDGGMPQHGHGLPTSPQMTENLGGGLYKIEGVRFNMWGWWEFELTISSDGVSDIITFNLVL